MTVDGEPTGGNQDQKINTSVFDDKKLAGERAAGYRRDTQPVPIAPNVDRVASNMVTSEDKSNQFNIYTKGQMFENDRRTLEEAKENARKAAQGGGVQRRTDYSR
jgi:hypothetical protein